MHNFVEDEPAFAKEIGPEMTTKVNKVAKAMCEYSSQDEEGEGCNCDTQGGSCIAFGLYGHLAHAAILAMQTEGE